jgi:hypothetical protein
MRDQRSGIWKKNLFLIPDPGPGVKRHRIPDPQHCASLFTLAEAVLQLALSWLRLAVLVFRLPAVNYQPSVVFLLYLSRWQTGP